MLSSLLHRLGRTAATHPLRVILVWLVLAATAAGAARVAGGAFVDNFEIPGTESQEALDLLQERFPQQAGATARLVFAAPEGRQLTDPQLAASVQSSLERVREIPEVASVPPLDPTQGGALSPDARVGFTAANFDIEMTEADEALVEELQEAVAPARAAGVQVEFGGDLIEFAGREEPGGRSEAIGLAVAVLVLLLAFGSVVAMGLPIATALVGLGIGLSLVTLFARFAEVNTIAPTLASMIGIAVGIDYALFVVTRFREHLRAGMPIVEGVARANATAGQAVLFAGTTVVIAIAGLAIVGVPFMAVMGIAAALVVAVAVALATTLLPALLGLIGTRIDGLKVPGLRIHTAGEEGESRTWSARWSRTVTRRPVPWLIGALVLLLALAAPTTAIHLAFPDAGTASEEKTHRRAYDLIAGAFGPGFNGPLLIAVDLRGPAAGLDAASRVRDAVAASDGILFAAPPNPRPEGDVAVIVAIPRTGPQDEATERLVHRLREDTLPAIESTTGVEAYVTGGTAAFIDVSERLNSRLAVFIASVLGLSFLLLALVFRSVLVPLKAALLNLLAISAAYGVVVAVFQWGWLGWLVGLEGTVPIAPFVPIMMFAILFGLSMDYEVFILSRIREAWLDGAGPTGSVVSGLAATARVVTAAATIMIAVFGGFVLQDDPIIKMFGTGLAVAVFLDATVVRMVLVPSTMVLLGRWNWWLPRWLDRALPHLDVEGARAEQAAVAASPGG